MANQNSLVGKISFFADNIRTYWDKPPLGKQMSWKEIFAFSGGGIGVYFIISIYNTILVQNTTNIILANCLGFSPTQVYFVFVISVIAGIPLAILKSHLIDNAQSKKGRFRPFLITMGFPTALLSILYVWLPYEHMDRRLSFFLVILFNIAFQFFFNFYKDAYESLILVLSSNTYERSTVSAIKSVVYSLAPSILNAVTPLFAQIISNGDMADIRLYRYIYPPFAIFGFMFSLIVYANVREKMVQAKTHVPQIKLSDSFRMVLKNKYIWIISLAGWVGFLEGSIAQVLFFLYEYGHACSAGLYSVITLVYGNASLWGMLLAPAAIRKFGKQKVIIATNACNILFLAMMYPYIENIWFVLACMFLNSVVQSFSHILTPSIDGDIRDYQHYIAGERIDGAFTVITYLGTIIGMITSSILPVIYKAVGIFEGNGFDNPYDILDVNENVLAINGDGLILYHVLRVLLLFSILGAVLNVIPYFFYNLSEAKHRAIVKVLRIRALFEDYGNKVYKDRELVEVIDMIEEAKAVSGKEPIVLDKSKIKIAKKTKDADAIKKAKAEYKKDEHFNESVADSVEILAEINKYNTPLGQKKLEFAKKVYAGGYAGLSKYDPAQHEKIKALAHSTKDEKEYRKFALEMLSYQKRSAKLISEHYPNGVGPFDMTELISLYDKINDIDEEIRVLYEQYDKIKDKNSKKSLKEKISELKVNKRVVNSELEKVNKKYVMHHRIVKPYDDAFNIINQEKNYRSYEELHEEYDEAKRRAEETEKREIEEEKKRQADEAAYTLKVKEEKAKAKAAKKNVKHKK